MTRRALEMTRAEGRAATAGPPPTRGEAGAAPVASATVARSGGRDAPPRDWPRLIDALRATDADDLPLFGRFPA